MFYKTQARPDHNGNNEDKLLVIGVGLPRTGTTSLCQALSHLLQGTCFHGSRLPNLRDEEYDFWLRALGKYNTDTRPTINEWREIFRGEKACMDLPSILFYKELMLAFPTAKIILTDRNVDKWFDSWWKTIGRILNVMDSFPVSWVFAKNGNPKMKQVHQAHRNYVPDGCSMSIDQAFSSRTLARQFYHEWVDEVKRCVPPHKLLVYKVEHGWDPLCEFLDLPIPSSKSLVPFPRCNVKNDIEFAILKMQLISWTVLILLITLPLIILGVIYRALLLS